MRIEPFKQSELKMFASLLCDGYILTDVETFDELRSFIHASRAKHPNCRLLTTLDDHGQAAYTSGHAIMAHRLDDVLGHDLSALEPTCFENGAHIGSLTTKAEFPIRLANMQRASEPRLFDDLQGKLTWGPDDWGLDFFELNAAPSSILDHAEILVQIVPVEQAFETLAAFPNGYFTDDLSPLDSWCLAKHLDTTYGIELFGIGASYMAFEQTRPLNEREQRRAATDILSLYNMSEEPALQGQMIKIFEAPGAFVLRFTQ